MDQGRTLPYDKVAELARLVAGGQHEIVVINDSDVRLDQHYRLARRAERKQRANRKGGKPPYVASGLAFVLNV